MSIPMKLLFLVVVFASVFSQGSVAFKAPDQSEASPERDLQEIPNSLEDPDDEQRHVTSAGEEEGGLQQDDEEELDSQSKKRHVSSKSKSDVKGQQISGDEAEEHEEQDEAEVDEEDEEDEDEIKTSTRKGKADLSSSIKKARKGKGFSAPGFCCQNGDMGDLCNTCYSHSMVKVGTYCARKSTCGGCGGTWCPATCVLGAANPLDWCGSAYRVSVAKHSSYCGKNHANCRECKGQWCAKIAMVEDESEKEEVEEEEEEVEAASKSFCCYDSSSFDDVCGTCYPTSKAEDHYCSHSETSCRECKGSWCSSKDAKVKISKTAANGTAEERSDDQEGKEDAVLDEEVEQKDEDQTEKKDEDQTKKKDDDQMEKKDDDQVEKKDEDQDEETATEEESIFFP
eukprot:TRINITY_DN4200_c0_g1_i2.p1 TRINITY_DN4200_c0_g1~~TRINITY_DN4200_c0_g1_i2.p1  ORF type:complete len:398 (+),score=125.77 TRINITY_DN4200_c0_g1_i2:86-1279(+)